MLQTLVSPSADVRRCFAAACGEQCPCHCVHRFAGTIKGALSSAVFGKKNALTSGNDWPNGEKSPVRLEPGIIGAKQGAKSRCDLQLGKYAPQGAFGPGAGDGFSGRIRGEIRLNLYRRHVKSANRKQFLTKNPA
jgi:hypothetical protein